MNKLVLEPLIKTASRDQLDELNSTAAEIAFPEIILDADEKIVVTAYDEYQNLTVSFLYSGRRKAAEGMTFAGFDHARGFTYREAEANGLLDAILSLG